MTAFFYYIFMQQSDITEAFLASTEALKLALEEFDSAHFMQHPKNGGWSAAEVAEHLSISDKSAYIAMIKNPQPADRDPLEKYALFEERRKAHGAKYEAPDAARPTGKFNSKTEAIEAWHATRLRIMDLIKTEDLTMTGGGFEHPKLGWMTRLEWLVFMTWHGDHHRNQLFRIKENLEGVK